MVHRDDSDPFSSLECSRVVRVSVALRSHFLNAARCRLHFRLDCALETLRGTAMQKLRAWTILSVGVIALFAPLLFRVSPAEATTGSYSDPRPCSASVNNGICISQVSADYTSTAITLTATVGQARDPSTDPNWESPATGIGWNIAPDGATLPSYVAVADDDPWPGPFHGQIVQDSSMATVCDSSSGVTVSFDATTSTYGISFPASCIGNPSSIAVDAVWIYGTAFGTVTAASPMSGGCCAATPDAASTSTTTTSLTSTTTTSPTSTTSTTSPTGTTSTTTATSTTTTTTTSSNTATSTTVPPTVSTTAAPVIAVSAAAPAVAASAASSQLAFTGVGDTERWLVFIGGLIVLGSMFVRWRLHRHAKAD